MKTIAFIAALGLAAVPAAAQDTRYQQDPGTTTRTDSAATQKNTNASKQTRIFSTQAASGNTLEIETSRLALQKSQNDDVKSFAQMMIDDHTKVGEQMKAAMQEAGLPPPAEQLVAKHQDMLNKLNQAGTDKFDGQYVAVQIRAHDEAIALFSNYAKSGDNAQLKQFAEATLPSLEKHKTMAADLKSKLGGGAATQ